MATLPEQHDRLRGQEEDFPDHHDGLPETYPEVPEQHAMDDTTLENDAPAIPELIMDMPDDAPQEGDQIAKKPGGRKLRPMQPNGKQASVAQIRDLRLLSKFVKDFELPVKQSEIDKYLGFKERTSRRLRKVKTKSELVAEGLLERHPRADNAKKAREAKGKTPGEKPPAKKKMVEVAAEPIAAPPPPGQMPLPDTLPNGYMEGITTEYDPFHGYGN